MCKLNRFTVKVYIIYFPVQVYTKPVYCKRLHNACLLLSVHKVSLPSTTTSLLNKFTVLVGNLFEES